MPRLAHPADRPQIRYRTYRKLTVRTLDRMASLLVALGPRYLVDQYAGGIVDLVEWSAKCQAASAAALNAVSRAARMPSARCDGSSASKIRDPPSFSSANAD